jgi:hypothetical protein
LSRTYPKRVHQNDVHRAARRLPVDGEDIPHGVVFVDRCLPLGVHRGDEPPEPVVGVANLLRQRRSAPEQQDQSSHEANFLSRATHAVS